jgi:hypothetical protein
MREEQLSPNSNRRRSASNPEIIPPASVIPPNLRREFLLSRQEENSWIDVDTDDDGNKLKSEIIYKFPPEKEIPFEAVPFCFPHQTQIKKVLSFYSSRAQLIALLGSTKRLLFSNS